MELTVKHWLIRLMKFLLIDRKNFTGASAVFLRRPVLFFIKPISAALTQKKEYDRLSFDRSDYHGSNYHR